MLPLPKVSRSSSEALALSQSVSRWVAHEPPLSPISISLRLKVQPGSIGFVSLFWVAVSARPISKSFIFARLKWLPHTQCEIEFFDLGTRAPALLRRSLFAISENKRTNPHRKWSRTALHGQELVQENPAITGLLGPHKSVRYIQGTL